MKAKHIFLLIVVGCIGFAFAPQDASVYNAKKNVMLDGTDVVSILKGSPCDGKKEITTAHAGLTYQFCNQENLNAFKSNPEKYMPAFGGWCAYALVEKPQKVEINPKNFKVVNGKLLLFYNAWGINTQDKWDAWGDDEKYFKLAEANWNKLKTGK